MQITEIVENLVPASGPNRAASTGLPYMPTTDGETVAGTYLSRHAVLNGAINGAAPGTWPIQCQGMAPTAPPMRAMRWSGAERGNSAVKKYRVAFRISSDSGSELREVTAPDRETTQYVYTAPQSLPDLHTIELCEWRPGDRGVLGYGPPGRYVVLSASG